MNFSGGSWLGRPPDNAESLEGKVFVQVAHRKETADGEERLVTATVRVFAKQPVGLVIAPKTLLISVDQRTGKGSGRLMLRGDHLAAKQNIIEAITSEGYRVKWTMSAPTSVGIAIVQLEMARPDKQSFGQSGFLDISLAGRGVQRVSFVVTPLSSYQE